MDIVAALSTEGGYILQIYHICLTKKYTLNAGCKKS